MDVHSPKNGIFIGIDPYPHSILIHCWLHLPSLQTSPPGCSSGMPQVLRVLRPGFPGLPWLRPFLGGPSWSKRSLSAVGHFQLIKKNAVNHGVITFIKIMGCIIKPIKNGIKTITCTTLDGWKPIKKWDKNHLPTAGFRETIHRIDMINRSIPSPHGKYCWSRRCVNLPKPWFMGVVKKIRGKGFCQLSILFWDIWNEWIPSDKKFIVWTARCC